VEYLNPATKQVLKQGDNFHDADQFPLANLPVDLGPWALIALGLGVGAVGVLLWSGRSRLLLVVVVVAGVGLLFGPVVLGWHHQTEAASEIAQVARGPFSAELANTTVDDTFSFNAAFVEMRQAMFPAVAKQLGKSPQEMDDFLHTSFPATMKFLDRWDATIYHGAHDLSLSQIEFMDEFHNADATPYTALPWIFMAPGLILLVAGGYVLISLRRSGDPAVAH
jgi:hypothetical protein